MKKLFIIACSLALPAVIAGCSTGSDDISDELSTASSTETVSVEVSEVDTLKKALAVEISDVVVTEPTGPNSAVYARLKNDSDEDIKLVGIESEDSLAVELHEVEKVDGLIKMSPIDEITIPAHGEVSLEHGGYHGMILDAEGVISEGDEVSLSFLFDGDMKVDVKTTVSAGGGHHHHD